MKILMIVTSHDQLGNSGQKTGLWLEELAAPYYEFEKHNFEVDIASPKGGEAPVDPHSLQNTTETGRRFLADSKAMGKVRATTKIADVQEKYDAYFVVGGHGIMWDGPDNRELQELLRTAYEDARIVSAVCHGPAALVNVRLSNGDYLVHERKINSFTNEEECALKLDTVVPFLLESKLRERNAFFEKCAPQEACVVQDGHLVTGQNPASAPGVAKAVASLLIPEPAEADFD